VVVLGVMYPNVFSRQQPSDAAIEVRQHSAVIFYDPFSPDRSEELTKHRPSGGDGKDQQELRCRKAAKLRQESRREAIQAVVNELARLSARNQDHENG
jgi:hypothetical protein